MLAPGDRVIVAVSGGPDSVCLFHALRELNIPIAGVTHVNHKLRGEASEEDQRFVEAMAAAAGVPFFLRAGAVTKGNLEQAARRIRYTWWAEMIRGGFAEKIATGHTRDDQAETVLFRLLRGSGPAGLAGILPVTEEGIIRPLLEASRAEVETYLRERGIRWREDASNQDPRFARNRIRHELLPQLAREWNPRVAEVLAHTADIAREEEAWWRGEIARIAGNLLYARDGATELRASALAALPKAVSRRLIRFKLGPLDFEHVERILDLAAKAQGEGRLELPGVLAIRSFDWMRWSAPGPAAEPEPVEIQPPARIPWPGGFVCFEVSETTTGTKPCARLKLCTQHSPLRLGLRAWRAGDRYRPAGRSSENAIQSMFQRDRVPSWRRESWPIVTDGARILWSRQFGPAAEFDARDTPGQVLRIWEEKSPGS